MISAKEKERMHKVFAKSETLADAARKLGKPYQTTLYHWRKWQKQEAYETWKKDNYIQAIGTDKPSPDWNAVGQALIQLGRALCGHHTV